LDNFSQQQQQKKISISTLSVLPGLWVTRMATT